jgi:hypothetical protein
VSGPTERTHWELHHALAPDQVVAAMTDFSERRPAIWSETCDPAVYRVHAVGPDWAEATEGLPGSWSRERYDWSTPGVVTLTQLAGNIVETMGSIRYTISPAAHGGSQIVCDRERHFRGDISSRVRGTLMKSLGGPILRRQFRTGLDRWSALLVGGRR